MAQNKGKNWESRFKRDWKRCFPNSFLLRLYDTTNGFITIANPCDFLAMPKDKLFLIECKSHKGASIPFDAIPQYERLLEYVNMDNIRAGVVVWFIDKDRVVWVSIKSMLSMKNREEKSIKLSKLDDGCYDFIEIPAKKLRTFMECDYTVLLEKDDAKVMKKEKDTIIE